MAAALRADPLARVAPRRMAQRHPLHGADDRRAGPLGHDFGNLQAQRRAGWAAARLRTALAADVHPRARRAGDRSRLAAQAALADARLARRRGRHARLGRTRPRRGRERPLRDRLGPCGGHRHAGRAVGLGHPPAVVHGTDGSLHPPDLLLTHLSGQTLPDGPRVGYGGRHRAGTGGLLDLPETVPPKKGAAIAAPFPSIPRRQRAGPALGRVGNPRKEFHPHLRLDLRYGNDKLPQLRLLRGGARRQGFDPEGDGLQFVGRTLLNGFAHLDRLLAHGHLELVRRHDAILRKRTQRTVVRGVFLNPAVVFVIASGHDVKRVGGNRAA